MAASDPPPTGSLVAALVGGGHLESAAFDRAVEQAVRPWAVDDVLEMPVVATLSWGRPRVRASRPG